MEYYSFQIVLEENQLTLYKNGQKDFTTTFVTDQESLKSKVFYFNTNYLDDALYVWRAINLEEVENIINMTKITILKILKLIIYKNICSLSSLLQFLFLYLFSVVL